MKRLFALTLLALLFPASAKAACGVPQKQAFYETPEVQIYSKHGNYRACYRATGRSFAAGYAADGADEEWSIGGLLAGRYLSLHYYGGGDDYDSREWHLLDLRTGKSTMAVATGDHEYNDVAVLPGALVTLGAHGLAVQYADGRKETLDAAATGELASNGARVYWGTRDAPQTALLGLPAAEPPRAAPRARTIGRCRPRRGARLLEHAGALVITRVAATVYACRNGHTRTVGPVTGAHAVGDAQVNYRRPGVAGVFAVTSGDRRELPSADGTLLETNGTFIAGGPAGVATLFKRLTSEPATAVALGSSETTVFWMDGAGNPRATLVG